ncbi:MAG TPA: MATE family efflux transporter [Vicinamibacterales bacterium]|nr:MATE family efflux transporter [Vicinamibacterales bacterium]
MRGEIRAMWTLAWPVVVAEVGWLVMGIVDTIMVAPLGAAAIGAVGAGSIIFMAIMMPGFGTLLALDTFVSQSYGAGRIDECHRWLFAGIHLAIGMTLVLSAASFGTVWLLPRLGFHPDVLAELTPYMTHLVWSVAPLFGYLVFRRYLQAMNIVRPIMAALITANIVNVLANWVLITGRYGFPALGVVGAAYATVFSRLGMALFLIGLVVIGERRRPSGLHDVPFTIDLARMWTVVRVGLPAAGQLLLEVGVFATASALAGRITPAAVAAHQIVLNVAGFIYMIPYGIGTAAAVRVGQAVGRGDGPGMRMAGWVALGLATSVMTVSAVLFSTLPRPLVRIFTTDVQIVDIGASLLLVAAVFQLCDGLQTVATGALRGLGETRLPFFWNLAGHWFVGLPIGYHLAFSQGLGVLGLWIGLSIGLIMIGLALLIGWHRHSRSWERAAREGDGDHAPEPA